MHSIISRHAGRIGKTMRTHKKNRIGNIFSKAYKEGGSPDVVSGFYPVGEGELFPQIIIPR